MTDFPCDAMMELNQPRSAAGHHDTKKGIHSMRETGTTRQSPIDIDRANADKSLKHPDTQDAGHTARKVASQATKKEDGARTPSSGITSKQVVAMAGIVLLVLLYVIALVAAVADTSSSGRLFLLCLFATVAIPILIWIYTWMYGKLKGRHTFADFRTKEQEERLAEQAQALEGRVDEQAQGERHTE